MFEDSNFPWIKFVILFIPLEAYVIWAAPGLKWGVLFTIGALIGVFTALSGKSIGKSHGPGS